MRHFLFISSVAIGLSLTMISCIPSDPGEETEIINPSLDASSSDELVKQWLAMAVTPDKFIGSPQPFEIIDKLSASHGETALTPIIQFLGDPEASGESKQFVLQCVYINMTPAYISVIEPLMDSSYPADTRACATQLMGGIKSEKVIPILKKALEDESTVVNFTAKSGLAVHDVENHRKEFLALYTDAETDFNEKAEILRVILYEPTKTGMTDQEFSVLAEAIVAEDTPVRLRSAIAMLVIESKRPDALETIQASLEQSNDEMYKQLVQSTLARRNPETQNN